MRLSSGWALAVFVAGTVVASTSCRAPFVPDSDRNGSGDTTHTGTGGSALLPLRVGSSGPDYARAVASDAIGDAYVASYFSGTVDFDAGSGATAKIANGVYDIAIAKYGPDGTFKWVYSIGGSDADVPFNIKLGADGAAYVVGYASAGAICNGHVLPNAGGRDMLLMRVSVNGTCDWAVTVGGRFDDEGHDLMIDTNGDLIVTGFFADTVDFDPGSGVAELVSRGGTDGFIARYAADGTFRNVTQFGGPGDDAGNALALRSDGDVMAAGTFSETAIFGSSLAPLPLISYGAFDYFLARYAGTLGLEWAIHGGGTGNDIVSTGGLFVAASGVTFVTGTFNEEASVGPGAGSSLLVSHGDADVFLANYDAEGVWSGFARTFGGTGTEGVSNLAVDAAGNLYLGGSFQGAVDFDPGAGTHILNGLGSNGAGDAFVLSLTSAGDLRWVNPISGEISGSSNYAITGGLSLVGDGTLWTVGRFFGNVDFDPSSAAANRVSVGDADQFVVRYHTADGSIVQ
jgi:hypothetical protein